MSSQVKNKVVLVTGASSGIGKAVSIEFALRQGKMALVGRNANALMELKKYIQDANGSAEIFPFDLSEVSKIPQLIKKIENHFEDSVSLLINNAGISVAGNVEDVPLDEFSNVMRINFLAPLAMIKAVIPSMKINNKGKIINISSGCGQRGLPGISAYCASKFALNAITECVRVELSGSGIKVLSFIPGSVATNIYKNTKTFGPNASQLIEVKGASPKAIAEKIFRASQRNTRLTRVSIRTSFAYHLNYWAPKLCDFILKLLLYRK
jgi:dehydrogenase/reductase SDR family member 7B